MTAFSDAELYSRGMATLIASWEEYARGAPGAAVFRAPGATCAVFPHDPERDFYNNALLKPHLSASERAEALLAMATTYAEAGVTRFAAWVHESDLAMRAALERNGYALDTSTRAMGMSLGGIPVPEPDLELRSPNWSEYLHLLGLPANFLRQADRTALRLVVASLGGEDAASVVTFDYGEDCGIYNVVTLERARRRGLGTALTAIQLHHARQRGCQSASLQSTPMAEGVYAALGFRDLGRILEYTP